MPARSPSLAESICLTLVTQGLDHGWALGSALAPTGEIGRVWTLSRPLTYRAVDGLVERRWLSRRPTSTGSGPGPGRERSILKVTAAGRREVEAWLDAPVTHLRDVRTELLVKLLLLERGGLDTRPLVARQTEVFASAFDELGADRESGDLVDLWRSEHTRAVRRFLSRALDTSPRAATHTDLRLSARNQLRATVSAVTQGDVMSTVKVVLPDGQGLTAAITRDAVEDLDLAVGDAVVVIAKSTEVMIAKPNLHP